MRREGSEQHEMDSLSMASEHWLRHAAATFGAPLVTPKTFWSTYDIATSVRDRARTITLKIKRVDIQ